MHLRREYLPANGPCHGLLSLSPRPKPPGHERTKPLAWKSGHLPPAGSVITRVYKGETLEVKILVEGFEFEGEVYKSLSAFGWLHRLTPTRPSAPSSTSSLPAAAESR